MNFLSKLTFLVLAAATSSYGELLSVNFDRTAPRVSFDPVYKDGESAIFAGQVAGEPRIEVTMRGQDYLQAVKGSETWGLLDNSLPGNEERPGWLVRAGWQPDAEGIRSFSHPHGQAPAGFIELSYTRPDDLIFKDLSLHIQDPENLELLNVWAASSADNYETLVPTTVFKSTSKEFLDVTLTNINYSGVDPLKVRIYGLIGEDDGTFNINGTIYAIPNPTPVPEPSSLMLLGLPLYLSLRRNRKQ